MSTSETLEYLDSRRDYLTARYLEVQYLDSRRNTMDPDASMQAELRMLAREINRTSAAIRQLTKPRGNWLRRLVAAVA